MKIYQVNIKCFNLIGMKEFYTKVLEMELVTENDDGFAVLVGKTKLEFEKVDKLPFYHLCFRTNESFYDYMYQKLEKQSVLFPHPDGELSFYWKGKQAYFTDPDGNILEMLERPLSVKDPQIFLSW
ncbi:MAG TPA: VOC family protein, partial [Pseudoneobacillus sp.]|nr:VOC family protein [Pseudoneobacillus sp.]